jgi:hypothetical protein
MRDYGITLRRSSRSKKTKRKFPSDVEDFSTLILPPKIAYKYKLRNSSKISPHETSKVFEPRRSLRLQNKAIKVVKAVEVVKAVKPVEAVKAVKPVEAVKAVKPVEEVEAVKAVKPVEAVKAMKPVEAIKPEETIQLRNIGTLINLPKNDSALNREDDIVDWSSWECATATKNYMTEDSFLDVLKYKSSNIIKADANYAKDIGQMISATNNTTSFVPNLLSHGNIFETKIINLLKTELGENNCKNVNGNYAPRSYQKYQETLKAIRDGIPVIFQGILRNYENQTYGVADIIIRSDWINRFLDVNALSLDELSIPSPKLGANYHYVIIDIKYKILALRADGIHLRNDANLKAYKSQLLIYTTALSKIQGYEAPYAFILGTKWKYTKNAKTFEGKNCFERLGKIDYADLDNSYIEKTRLALEWLRDVRQNDYDLSKYPLARDELYPNMCNRYDYPYHNIKKTFAEKHNDLTLLWNVGPKQRRIANNNGIYDWKDPKCTPEALGVNGKVRSKVLARILEANHSETRNIFPKYVEINVENWQDELGLQLFCDFETTCAVFNDMEDLPELNYDSFIFLIGVGYLCPKTKKWIYKEFCANRISEEEEKKICLEFYEFVKNLEKANKINIPIWHYSHAEKTFWKRFEKRSQNNFPLNWRDLLKVFIDGQIGVKKALNYSLKTITKAFYEHGFISTSYDNSAECSNGTDAALQAYQANKDCIKRGISMKDHECIQYIIRYNQIDVKVMWEILSYLRLNHILPKDKLTKKRARNS